MRAVVIDDRVSIRRDYPAPTIARGESIVRVRLAGICGTDLALAIFTEPLAAAYEIFEQTQLSRNHRILVLGDGRLGALVAMALLAEGYDAVAGGHHPEKAERFDALGITFELEQNLKPGYAVVVDCTGASADLSRALELVRPRGTLILKSTAATSGELNLAPVVINEITVIGSQCGRFAPALAALSSGRIDPRPLISQIIPLDDGLHALDEAAKPSNIEILLKLL